jgi:transposase-like protein
MALSFKGAHFPPDIILMGVCWYVAHPLSTRHIEELILERGVHVDHSRVVFQKWRWPSLHCPSKGIAVDK